jgi:hypothetical protein
MTELTPKSFDLKYEIMRNGDDTTEIAGRHWTFTKRLEEFRRLVDI